MKNINLNNFIPYGRHFISDEDINEVVKILKSGPLTQGPKLGEFENLVANKVSVKYSIAVNSATSALHLACKALDLKKDQFLWTSSISFVASANCALYFMFKISYRKKRY